MKTRKMASTALTLTIIMLLAIVIGVVYVVGQAYCWYGHDYDDEGICERCGEVKPVEDLPDEDDEPVENGGMTNVEANSEGLSLRSRKILRSEYADEGISTLAESAQQLTATVTPAEATNQEVDWSVAFKNPNSTWATGKTVTDYVSISPSSSDDKICTVICAQAFGEQIIVKCQSVDYPDIYATATVDYVRKLTGVTLSINCDDSSFETNYNGIRRVRVLDDPDTYTFVPTAVLEDTYTIDKSYDVDFSWQISTDTSKGLLGESRNTMNYAMSGKYNLSMVDNPTVHTEKTVELSLDFLCKEIFADRFTNTSQYITSSEVTSAQNCMRNAVIAGLKYCYKQSPGYIFTATVSCEDYSQTYSIALSTVDVSVPLESISLNFSALQF